MLVPFPVHVQTDYIYFLFISNGCPYFKTKKKKQQQKQRTGVSNRTPSPQRKKHTLRASTRDRLQTARSIFFGSGRKETKKE
mmetsp:Transcript_16583/g.33571  ORF Transcript_16583/g.33571 Transcript_16583/m.33571 type:complete len:82 (-) Transcript_16583:350-595(-)